jgi:hypothetical protein
MLLCPMMCWCTNGDVIFNIAYMGFQEACSEDWGDEDHAEQHKQEGINSNQWMVQEWEHN